MAVGFKYGTITLDEPTAVFYPGQVITGKIDFATNTHLAFRVLNIQFLGEAKVSWTENQLEEYNGIERNKEIRYKGREEYFNFVQCLAGGNGVFDLSPNIHSLPFKYQIPFIAPSSFTGEKGQVSYTITAYIDYQDTFMEREELVKHFKVVAPMDLNQCSVVIRREVYHSQQPRADYESPKKVLATTQKGPVMGKSQRTFTCDLRVPNMIAPNLQNCRIIDVRYCFKVTMKLSGCNDDLEDESEISIGLVPLSDFPGSENYIHPMKHSLPSDPIPEPNKILEVKNTPYVPKIIVKDSNPLNNTPYPIGNTSCSPITSFKEPVAPYPIGNNFSSQFPTQSSDFSHSFPGKKPASSPYPVDTFNSNKPPYPMEKSEFVPSITPYPPTYKPPYPMDNKPYSDANKQAYPIDNKPYPEANIPPYPVGNIPYSDANKPLYPMDIKPYPDANKTPYPMDIKPYPDANKPPYPMDNKPYSDENKPAYPIDNKPYPEANIPPYPVKNKPYPDINKSPYPTENKPYPSTNKPPNPMENKPHPDANNFKTTSFDSVNLPYPTGDFEIAVSSVPKPTDYINFEVGFKDVLSNDYSANVNPPYPIVNKMPKPPSPDRPKSPYYVGDLEGNHSRGEKDLRINLPMLPLSNASVDPTAPSAPPPST